MLAPLGKEPPFPSAGGYALNPRRL